MMALGQVVWHFTLIRNRTRDACLKAFRLKPWLGLAVFAGIAASDAAQVKSHRLGWLKRG